MKYVIVKRNIGEDYWAIQETLRVVDNEELARSIIDWLKKNDTTLSPRVYKYEFYIAPTKVINNMNEFIQYFHEEIEF